MASSMTPPDDQLLTPEEFAALEITPTALQILWRRHRGGVAHHLQLKSITARCLLAGVLLALAVVVTWMGIRYHRRMTFIENVEQLGGSTGSDATIEHRLATRVLGDRARGFESIDTVWLCYPHVSDDSLAELAQLDPTIRAELGTLNVRGSAITDEGIKHISEFRQLENLWLGNTGVTESGLRALGKHPSLEFLDLSEIDTNLASLRVLHAVPHLSSLGLADTQITDDMLRELSSDQDSVLQKLTGLALSRTQITDTGLMYLAQGSRLEILFLDGTNITDAGLKHLGRIRTLHTLDLTNTAVSNAGLEHLLELEELHRLRLSGTDVTPDGGREFERRMPNCRIEWNYWNG